MPSVLAVAAHPDDIEFLFAGTMLRLASAGWDLHYMNIADGSRGSMEMDMATTAATRLAEAKSAAAMLGATFYGPIATDFEIDYNPALVAKVAAVVRQCRASIVLTHAPVDYMEDHQNACRLAVSAAFAHGMPNLMSDPPVEHYTDPVTVYHAQPLSHRTPMGDVVTPHFWIDTTDVIDAQEASLACHASQKDWLDRSQGMDSYLQTMRDMAALAGRMSGKFQYAEGWRRRNHPGFCGPDDDPLRQVLSAHCH